MKSGGGRRCRLECASPLTLKLKLRTHHRRGRPSGRRGGGHALRGGRWCLGCPGRPGASYYSIWSLLYSVIIVPFLDGLIGAEVPAHTWFGAFLSLFGVIMLELSGSPPCVGDLLNLLSAFSFAIHMLRTEHISRNIKKENFLTLVGCEVFVVAILSAASYTFKCFTQNVQHWNLKVWSPSELFGMAMLFPWPAILYTGILSTSFCLWAEVSFVVIRSAILVDEVVFVGTIFLSFSFRWPLCALYQLQKLQLFMVWNLYGVLLLHG
uniref:EamA domain-containing protein n=1 Tax=Zea mays TaxID=4577 RepID=A0A804PWD2_MAIZE